MILRQTICSNTKRDISHEIKGFKSKVEEKHYYLNRDFALNISFQSICHRLAIHMPQEQMSKNTF